MNQPEINRSLQLIEELMQQETPGTPIYEAAKELRDRIVAIISYRKEGPDPNAWEDDSFGPSA